MIVRDDVYNLPKTSAKRNTNLISTDDLINMLLNSL